MTTTTLGVGAVEYLVHGSTGPPLCGGTPPSLPSGSGVVRLTWFGEHKMQRECSQIFKNSPPRAFHGDYRPAAGRSVSCAAFSDRHQSLVGFSRPPCLAPDPLRSHPGGWLQCYGCSHLSEHIACSPAHALCVSCAFSIDSSSCTCAPHTSPAGCV